MRTSITLLGRQFGMARRANRRLLVAIFYAVFAVVMALTLFISRNEHAGFFWATWFTLMLGPILGGYFAQSTSFIGSAGLVEPFDGQKVLYYPKNTGMSYFRSLFHPKVDPDPGLRVDERSIRERNRAGFKAFKYLGEIVSIAFFVDRIGGDPETFYGLGMTTEQSHRVVRLLLQFGYLLACTLPQAILLWTEPDMDAEAETATR